MSDMPNPAFPIEVGGDTTNDRLARYQAIKTLLDVCSTQSLQTMASALSNPPEGDTRSAGALALGALARNLN